MIGGTVVAAFFVFMGFLFLNATDGPSIGNLGQCDSSWMISHVKQIKLRSLIGNDVDILDVTKIRELSRRQNVLFCTGLGYLTIAGKQQIYWSLEFVDPRKSNNWYLQVSPDPQS